MFRVSYFIIKVFYINQIKESKVMSLIILVKNSSIVTGVKKQKTEPDEVIICMFFYFLFFFAEMNTNSLSPCSHAPNNTTYWYNKFTLHGKQHEHFTFYSFFTWLPWLLVTATKSK